MTPTERAEKIRELMKQRGIGSVLQLAQDIDIHYKTLYRIMSGKHGCNTETINKLAKRLSVSESLLI